MFHAMFLPLDRQDDGGFYVIGEAFKGAAAKLIETDPRGRNPNGHLPINYLYRHALELLLKSAISTVHRALQLPSGDEPHEPEPRIRINGKSKKLSEVHSVKSLLDALDRILTENKAEMERRDCPNWEVPQNLKDWITTIEAADQNSQYFRYPYARKGPTAEDARKSGFVPIDVEKMVAMLEGNGKPNVILAMKDDDDNIVEAFAMQHDPLPELREALIQATEMQSAAAFGLNAELVGGYTRNRKKSS